MKMNWRAAWPLFTGFLLILAAEVEDIYDDSKATAFQPELIIVAGMSFLGVLFGTTSNKELAEKTTPE